VVHKDKNGAFWCHDSSVSGCGGLPHPVVGQLQAELDESVGADAQLLDAALPKVPEREDVAVHVVRQHLRHRQGAGHLSLDLTHRQRQRRRHF